MTSPTNNAPIMLACPNCGADDEFTSWESALIPYYGVKFFMTPGSDGREVDYDGVYDTGSGDGEFTNDIECRSCGTMSLTLAGLITPDGQIGTPEPVKVEDPFGTAYVSGEAHGFSIKLMRADDGAMLVQIDTEAEPYGEHVLRVYVNDGIVFDGEDEPVIEWACRFCGVAITRDGEDDCGTKIWSTIAEPYDALCDKAVGRATHEPSS